MSATHLDSDYNRASDIFRRMQSRSDHLMLSRAERDRFARRVGAELAAEVIESMECGERLAVTMSRLFGSCTVNEGRVARREAARRRREGISATIIALPVTPRAAAPVDDSPEPETLPLFPELVP